jgi:hypothetical protein
VATLKGAYVEKYERRGKRYVVMKAEARGEDGRLLITHPGVICFRVGALGFLHYLLSSSRMVVRPI